MLGVQISAPFLAMGGRYSRTKLRGIGLFDTLRSWIANLAIDAAAAIACGKSSRRMGDKATSHFSEGDRGVCVTN